MSTLKSMREATRLYFEILFDRGSVTRVFNAMRTPGWLFVVVYCLAFGAAWSFMTGHGFSGILIASPLVAASTFLFLFLGDHLARWYKHERGNK